MKRRFIFAKRRFVSKKRRFNHFKTAFYFGLFNISENQSLAKEIIDALFR